MAVYQNSMNVLPGPGADPQLTNAVMRLLGHDDFQALLRHLETAVIPTMYREACGGNVADRRDWLAGRVSMLRDLVDEVQKIRAQKSEFSARPVKIGKW